MQKQIECRSLIGDVAKLSYYLYNHLNQTYTS